ncbi:caa(3)-type oxidase, subunit IV [Planctopirus limnophila DSM 3776]|uniref:Caa(3)-type oxidase, subunit IV n=1 Tax=Planctopirus limnophila (strain ATCC 43296 / DSM 3776 / IFAM 1008 / Mu 290) TaxID=521674 RepID=D5SS51_PLAL2|nr:cytochrome C oxidase subunit IV family protein [Planctopirus limnophila]ADG68775.1 caa(3)-type oxidase, subunit IV [Planctopirus limnophila DSM 3776]
MADMAHLHGNTYFRVFLALCGLTVLSVVADLLSLADRRIIVAIVLAVATAKALCVMLYFMHLKFESGWKYVLLAPTIVLALALPLSLLPDVGMHYYPQDTRQSREYARLQADGDSGHHSSEPTNAH